MFRFDSFKKSNEQDSSFSFLQRITSNNNSNNGIITSSTSSSSTTTTTSNSNNSDKQKSNTSIPIPVNSWGMLVLSQLQNQQEDFIDIINILTKNSKAIVLLPVSIPSHPSAIVDHEFIMDHILIPMKEEEESDQMISPSGIHSVIEGDQLIIANLIESFDIHQSSKKSLFSLGTSHMKNHPRYTILASHIQLPLQDQQINVILIQKPISRKEIMDWTRQDALKGLSTSDKVEKFIKQFKKNPPRTTEGANKTFLAFMQELHQDASDDDDDASLDKIESLLCEQLYDYFFTDPHGDEAMQGEALESRIAAFNLLDLDLSHLGVSLSQEEMNTIVKLAGAQLQELNTIKGPKEKLDAIIKTHQIITETVQQDAEKKELLNTDILLPLLIYTIVKTNPKNLLANLKFIQQFRRPDQLRGQSGYCLTNMMAAVSFLETANLVGLGLSADKVISHVADLQNSKAVTPSSVKQSSGLKLMNDVVDSSYKAVFEGIGKLWQRNNNSSNIRYQDGPITKFLEMKSVDELKIGEVTELLADYKRLAAIIKQAGLA
ncbi:hypothetical protein RMATCC62417_03837 [Rhizopus microsporus]|nr:hypothetical protein RMATCC62417_03837 [Rhizopus microsporus]